MTQREPFTGVLSGVDVLGLVVGVVSACAVAAPTKTSAARIDFFIFNSVERIYILSKVLKILE